MSPKRSKELPFIFNVGIVFSHDVANEQKKLIIQLPDSIWPKNHHIVQVSNGLPPTSYIKMIEYYLIFCLLVPCVEVLLHTVMDSLRL